MKNMVNMNSKLKKHKKKRFIPAQKKRKLNQVSPEVIFAQKLAANDPTIRNRAVKKLKKWLQVRDELLTSDEILRVWKGLHYCFWMSDKPLVQEELAESISSFVHCFKVEDSNVFKFIEAGMITEGREWTGIDNWRMDKYMMFIRRFLRQIFSFLKKLDWKRSSEFVPILSSAVISNPNAALGFRLHMADIYLEELAKVGGDELSSKIILELIEPFAKELSEGKDERLAKHILERIYYHLMRQSDLGIAYDESLENNFNVETEVDMDVGEGEDDEDDDEMPIMEENNVQDPRAGNVSVTLPQLKPDFEQLSQKLYSFGSSKNIPNKRRDMLYELTKQFKDLANEVYPLAPNVELEEEAKIPKVKVSKVAERRMKEENERQEKIKKEREEFKQALKSRKNITSSTVVSSEEILDENNEEILEENNEKKFDAGDETDPEVDPNIVTRRPLSEEKIEEENLNILKNVKSAEFSKNQQDESPQKKKKKKKKKKKNQNSNLPEKIQENSVIPEENKDENVEKLPLAKKIEEKNITEEVVVSKKDKKKKKKSKEIINNKLLSDDKKSNEKEKVEIEIEKTNSEISDIQTESSTNIAEKSPVDKVKKKKKKSKQLNESAVIETSSIEKASENPTKVVEKKKKKRKLEEEEATTVEVDSPPSAKKSKKKNSVKSLDSNQTPPKIFDDTDWGELDNANIKTTTNPENNFQAVFFKKKSKSTSKKLAKNNEEKSLLKNLQNSDKKRRISFGLSQNQKISFNEIDRSMQNSPDIPYEPDKIPKSKILKSNSANSTPKQYITERSMVGYNTKMNGKSKAAKKLGLNSREMLMAKFWK